LIVRPCLQPLIPLFAKNSNSPIPFLIIKGKNMALNKKTKKPLPLSLRYKIVQLIEDAN
jgi:hypothetical protein